MESTARPSDANSRWKSSVSFDKDLEEFVATAEKKKVKRRSAVVPSLCSSSTAATQDQRKLVGKCSAVKDSTWIQGNEQ
ncbi:hypothetical protein U1Q18_023639 [Sarracenia purpurea var. burkii]